MSDAQIERQDFVDNQIFNVLNKLNPTRANLDWDIEMIADVRDCIQAWITEKVAIDAQDFYPENQ